MTNLKRVTTRWRTCCCPGRCREPWPPRRRRTGTLELRCCVSIHDQRDNYLEGCKSCYRLKRWLPLRERRRPHWRWRRCLISSTNRGVNHVINYQLNKSCSIHIHQSPIYRKSEKMLIAQVCSTAAILADLVHNRRREELHHRFPSASQSSWRREQRDQEVGEWMHICAMSLCIKFFDLTYLAISAGNMNTFEKPACRIVNCISANILKYVHLRL